MAETQDDDLYPNDGAYLGGMLDEPEEQVVARQKEKAHTLQALSEIKKIIKHFDERIAFRNTLDAITVDPAVDPLLHQKLCIANNMVKDALAEEKKLLEDLLEVHAPNI